MQFLYIIYDFIERILQFIKWSILYWISEWIVILLTLVIKKSFKDLNFGEKMISKIIKNLYLIYFKEVI